MPRTLSNARVTSFVLALVLLASRTQASPIFLTGYDRQVHVQPGMWTRTLLTAGLQFATGAAYNAGQTLLSVGAFLSSVAKHLVAEDGLGSLGLVAGVDYGAVDAALSGTSLSSYDAIAIASSFGGMPTQVELDGRIAKSGALTSHVEDDGPAIALTDCAQDASSCVARALGSSPGSLGFAPLTVTSAGAAAVRPDSASQVARSDRH